MGQNEIKTNEWISIKDEQPEIGELILAYDSETDTKKAIIICDMFSFLRAYTHWMSFPNVPKK